MHTEKAPDSIFYVLLITYMVPQALQAFHIYHNKHFMYHNKHRRNFILCSKAQMQINSSIVRTSPCNSPYKLKCKASIYVPPNQVHITQGSNVAVAMAAATAEAATSAAEGEPPIEEVAQRRLRRP